MTSNPGRGRAVGYLGLYAAGWAASVGYLAATGGEWTTPVLVFVVFGLVLSAIAWALTRKSDPPPIPIARPGLELAAVLGFLVVYAVAFLGWGMGAVREAIPAGPAQEVAVLTLKLAVHVAAPALLLALLGAQLRPLFESGVGRRGFWPTLVVLSVLLLGLLCVVSPSLKDIAALHPAATTLAWAVPATFVWMVVEAGLTEEFLFRAVLQTRLSAVLRSETGAVVIGALLFGLAHVPGLFLRGEPGTDGYSTDLFQVIAYAVGTLTPIALLFGLIWARTRSLLLVVLLHAMVDVLPNTSEFLKTWVGLS